MKTLFKNHINLRIEQVKKIMEAHQCETLYIESGFPDYYYLDDQPTLFKPNPHFSFFCPDPGQGHLLKISLAFDKPELFFHIPDDFWHEISSLKGEFWEDSFQITVCNTVEKAWSQAKNSNGKSVIISPQPQTAIEHSCKAVSEEFLNDLNWIRSQKTDYEIECIKQANEKAAKGHKKAKELFLSGATEHQIFMEYLIASDQREGDLPYNSITAFNEGSAILHYQFPKRHGSGNTFLIDAGARFNLYCSDITRTYIKKNVSNTFESIINRVDEEQKKLCELVVPGNEYIDIHRRSNELVAQALVDFDIFKGTVNEAIEKRITFPFYPHGVGHPLGLQVHDVGAKTDKDGNALDQPEDFPHLRTLRSIQENDVLTIEPGFYFIPMLLKPLRENNKISALLNWSLIDEMIPFGGIRIEDNVVAKKEGAVNLTRPYLP